MYCITAYFQSFKVCSHYENNVHWKRINSHCLHSHWMGINRNSHWMCIQSIYFHRWFEAGLKVNCIMTWNNAGVKFSCKIGYVKKLAIRQEITSVTLLLCLGSCFIYYSMCNQALYALWPCSAISLLVLSSPLGGMHNLSAKLMLLLHHVNDWDSNKEAIVQFSCIIAS